ncbi:NADH dehydrogenase [Campylobacter fetus]|uniref:NADH dehydrogenase n=1 Tax=Campylobacter fetus TaxID=196 RepID=UPI000818B0E4|nr:NADH dehydrogenase [Campylobacter fetus]OCR84806.1 NADH dehydrogenase [Campylobacter fetus subsp. testudinum]OCS05270.1 NADH dehydrogenase [Campylobacter fetus subsp. testudinum]
MKVLSLASILSFQAPNLLETFKNDDILVISPLDDDINAKFVKCEIGSLSYVLALICKDLFDDEFFSSLDEGYLSGESNVGEEELPFICEFIKNCGVIIVSPEVLNSINSKQIQAMLNLLSNAFGIRIINLNGYDLSLDGVLNELDELSSFDGAVIFTHSKFNEFRGGEYFKVAAKLRDGDIVTIKTIKKDIKIQFRLDKNIKGTVGFLGSKELDYSYEILNIAK